MEDDLLLVRRLVGDDAGAADFRAGAGGGRHAIFGEIFSASARVHQSPMSSKSNTERVWPGMNATSLPWSSAEPPPTAITLSWPPLLNTSTPAFMFDSVGFGTTSAHTPT